MTSSVTKQLLSLLLIASLTVSGCRSRDAASLDNRMVWDKDGCAYTIEPGAGDTSFVRPMTDANRETCHRD